MKKIFKLMVLSKSAMLFFFLTLLAQIFSAIFHYIYPRYLQNLIDQYFIPWFEGKNPLAAIFLSLLGQLAVWVAAFLLIGVLGHWCLKVGNYRARLTLSDTIFDQYLHLPMGELDQEASGSIVNRLTSDVQDVGGVLFPSVLIRLPSAILTTLVALLGIFQVNAHVGLVVLLVLPAFAWFSRRYSKKVSPEYKRWLDFRGAVSGAISEVINLREIAQANGLKRPLLQKFIKASDDYRLAAMRFNIIDWGYFAALNIMDSVLPIFFTLLMCWMVFWGADFSIGGIIRSSTYISLTLQALQTLLDWMPTTINALQAGHRILEVLEKPREVDYEDQKPLVAAAPLAFSHVNFSYLEDRPVLKDVSFTMQPHTNIAFVGPTGSGKSTLIALLMRYRDPDTGTIQLGDVTIEEVSRATWRKAFALVSQDPKMFKGTLYDNLCLGKEEEISREKAGEALRQIVRDNPRFAEGLDLKVDADGANFSAGERQLIAMARALAFDPEILIMDEATATVDPYTEQLITEALDTLKKDRSMIIIAHRLSTIESCQQIFVLKEGRIVEHGTHASLLQQQGVYADMIRTLQSE